jgi:hypothetical protein
MARPSGWWFVLLVTSALAGRGGGDKVGSAPTASGAIQAGAAGRGELVGLSGSSTPQR